MKKFFLYRTIISALVLIAFVVQAVTTVRGIIEAAGRADTNSWSTGCF
ncbi:MAG: hypothetical protein LBS75_05605 [Synergistaceae bacterium]|nr:hypothetical protein [Synergistaceae bacterium]